MRFLYEVKLKACTVSLGVKPCCAMSISGKSFLALVTFVIIGVLWKEIGVKSMLSSVSHHLHSLVL